MKKSVTIKTKDNKHYNIGDPFILRFDGVYYLYPSGHDDEAGIRCFTSKDLITFEEYGYVVKDERLRNAYAPEVIYHDGMFLLCTSPSGNGHYFLKSKSPLGPFEFISDNIRQMIDGSFVHDEKFNIYFSRADHNGIAMLKYDGERLSSHHNMLPQISRAWTEGPTIYYEDGYYRATYCGNYVFSRNYRIKSASSKELTKGYVTDDCPLLLSTENGFHSLGHNSITRSRDLTKRVIAYHGRKQDDFSRYLYLDSLQFNGRRATVLFEDEYQKKPDYEHSFNFEETSEDVSIINGENFIAEFTFRSRLSVSLEEDRKHHLSILENKLIIDSMSYELPINTEHIHTLLLAKKESHIEIRIDEVPFKTLSLDIDSLVLLKDSIVDYVAASVLSTPTVFSIPNIIEATSINEKHFYSEEKEEYGITVKEEIEIRTKGEKGSYQLYANCLCNKESTLLISTMNSKQEIHIKNNNSDYDERFIKICDIDLMEEDTLSIQVLDGEFSFYRLEISAPSSLPEEYESQYTFYPRTERDRISFIINHFKEDTLFGMILDGKDYCSHPSIHHPKCSGYLIGLRNDLLVVEHLQYETERIYDVPVRIKEGEEHSLSYLKEDDHLKVYLDEHELISIDLPYEEKEGYNGRYVSVHSDVTIIK